MYNNYFRLVNEIMKHYDSSIEEPVELKFELNQLEYMFDIKERNNFREFVEMFEIDFEYKYNYKLSLTSYRVVSQTTISQNHFSILINFKIIKEIMDNYNLLENEIDKFLVDKIKSYIPISPLS